VNDPDKSGGAFALAGNLKADGGFVGLEAVLLEQSGMDEFVNGLAEVGTNICPVAEGVAREVHAVSPELTNRVVQYLDDERWGGDAAVLMGRGRCQVLLARRRSRHIGTDGADAVEVTAR